MGNVYAKLNVVLTAQNGTDRLTEKDGLVFSGGNPGAGSVISIDTGVRYQEIIGFGGAITEAVCYNLQKLKPENKKKILDGYYHPETGMGYRLCRIHMNSSDFCLNNYSCDDVQGDIELKHFNIDRDKQYLIPLLKEVLALNPDLKILVSPWSPPAWMKTTGQMNHGGKLRAEYRESWALFYVKFIQAYEREGIPIWAVSVQNEPLATQRWDSCIYTAEEERDFLRDYLGPALHDAGLSRIKVLVWDHNRDLMFDRSHAILSDKETNKYAWGIGFHWYSGEQFDKVAKCHEVYPDKALIFTEGCLEGGVKLGKWDRGERYGRNVLGDLNSWTNGWMDWNIALDIGGGPNHAANFCDSPIILDHEKNLIHYQNSYFYLGHFSRYIKPGAVRVKTESTDMDLRVTGFLNPDGSLAVVVLNVTDKPIEYALTLGGRSVKSVSPEHSIKTLYTKE
jgi:glucosylceramidase